MKFSEQWLREWVNPAIDTNALVAQITMAGLEVDSSEPVAGKFSQVIVGEVLETSAHPDAKKLTVCKVNVGQAEPLQIVCGASNVRAGLRVAVAMVGATLPNGMDIKDAELRGVASSGMLCSASELGLAETSEGILELDAAAPIGESLRDYLQLDDQSIDVDLTPNRGDCLSVRGIAREVGVLNQMDVTAVACDPISATIDDTFPIHLDEAEACPLYLGRVIRNINADAKTPVWMRERLRRSGLRSISPVVDVTNYVMLELGQPLHAFDLAKLHGAIHVRMANMGEALTLLDGKTIDVNAGTLVIADEQQALALAGIMGGEASAVSDATQDIFLECAYFNPVTISGRARQYGLSTDSSHRFERGVDPQLAQHAIERATALLQNIVGGDVGPVCREEAAEHIPEQQTITLRPQRVQRILGVAIENAVILECLQRLGFGVSEESDHFAVTVPPYRFDITLEVDLIEEIARIHGYDNIPSIHIRGDLAARAIPEAVSATTAMAECLIHRGFNEVITYSFVSPEIHRHCFGDQAALPLVNPISNELSQMRLSLWPGLLQTVAYNQHRQQLDCQLFETGLRFVPADDGLQQIPTVAGVRAGQLWREHWSHKAHPIDFYHLKADVEALLHLTGVAEQFEFVAAEHPCLHPGQSAQIRRNGEHCGWVGMLHPRLHKPLDLSGAVGLFECDIAAIATGEWPVFSPLSKFPVNRRDISFLIDEKVTSAEILRAIKSKGIKNCQDAFVFDIYAGKGVSEQQKSMAIGVLIADPQRTLVDQEISDCLNLVIETLTDVFRIQLRD